MIWFDSKSFWPEKICCIGKFSFFPEVDSFYFSRIFFGSFCIIFVQWMTHHAFPLEYAWSVSVYNAENNIFAVLEIGCLHHSMYCIQLNLFNTSIFTENLPSYYYLWLLHQMLSPPYISCILYISHIWDDQKKKKMERRAEYNGNERIRSVKMKFRYTYCAYLHPLHSFSHSPFLFMVFLLMFCIEVLRPAFSFASAHLLAHSLKIGNKQNLSAKSQRLVYFDSFCRRNRNTFTSFSSTFFSTVYRLFRVVFAMSIIPYIQVKLLQLYITA